MATGNSQRVNHQTWHSEEFNPEVDIFTVPLQYSSTTYTAIIRQASDVTAC